MKMEINSIRTLTAIGVTMFLTVGCATGPMTAVTESKKDSTGSFDGRWVGTITKTPPLQQSVGNVGGMRCSDLAGRNLGSFRVKDGQMAYSFGGDNIKTYVNSNGGFKLVIPVEQGGFSGGDGTFTAKKDTLTISGSLEDAKKNT